MLRLFIFLFLFNAVFAAVSTGIKTIGENDDLTFSRIMDLRKHAPSEQTSFFQLPDESTEIVEVGDDEKAKIMRIMELQRQRWNTMTGSSSSPVSGHFSNNPFSSSHFSSSSPSMASLLESSPSMSSLYHPSPSMASMFQRSPSMSSLFQPSSSLSSLSHPSSSMTSLTSLLQPSQERVPNISEVISSIDSPIKAASLVLIQGAMITSLEKHARGEKSTENDAIQFQTNMPKELAVLMAASQRLMATFVSAKSPYGYMFKEFTLESFLNTTAPPIADVSNSKEILCSQKKEDEPIKNLFKEYLKRFNATKALDGIQNCGNKKNGIEASAGNSQFDVQEFKTFTGRLSTSSSDSHPESNIKDLSFDKAVADIDSPLKAILISTVMKQMITSLENHAAGIPNDPTQFQTNMPKDAAALMAGIQRIAASQIYAKSQYGAIFKELRMESYLNTTPVASVDFNVNVTGEPTCEDFKKAKPMLDLLQKYLEKFNVKKALRYKSIKNCPEAVSLIIADEDGERATTTATTVQAPRQVLTPEAAARKINIIRRSK